MRMELKEKFFVLAIVALCLTLGSRMTLAYFTDEATARNVITSSGVDIEIEEWQDVAGVKVPYPSEKIDVMPGMTVSKIATVKNIEAETYIRAKTQIQLLDANEVPMDLEAEEIDKIIRLTMNGTDWLRKDGDSEWWYFARPVGTGESTSALFTQVVFDGENMSNEYQNCTVTVDVTAQAVQKDNNGSDALSAEGWPKNEKEA